MDENASLEESFPFVLAKNYSCRLQSDKLSTSGTPSDLFISTGAIF